MRTNKGTASDRNSSICTTGGTKLKHSERQWHSIQRICPCLCHGRVCSIARKNLDTYAFEGWTNNAQGRAKFHTGHLSELQWAGSSLELGVGVMLPACVSEWLRKRSTRVTVTAHDGSFSTPHLAVHLPLAAAASASFKSVKWGERTQSQVKILLAWQSSRHTSANTITKSRPEALGYRMVSLATQGYLNSLKIQTSFALPTFQYLIFTQG